MARTTLAKLRLLPATMAGLAALLAVKSAGLVGAAYGAAEQSAAAHAAPIAKPVAGAGNPAEHGEHTDATASQTAHGEPQTLAGKAAPVVSEKPSGAALTGVPNPAEAVPSPSERALLLNLRKRRSELDAKAAALDQREALLGAADKRIGARVDELATLQKRLEALEATRRDRDEASWRGLVRVYETMKPKEAALIFNDLDAPVLLQVVDRMKDGRAAAILAAMAPDRARRLTADLSALRSRDNAPPAAALDPASSRAPPDAAHPLQNASAAAPASAAQPASAAHPASPANNATAAASSGPSASAPGALP